MAAGDETKIGPNLTNAAGINTAAALMNTAYVGANDHYVVIPASNGMQFWVIHIEGA